MLPFSFRGFFLSCAQEKDTSCPPFLLRVLLRVSLTGLLKIHSFVSFRLFSFLFHTLKRTLKRKGGQRTGHYKQPSRVLFFFLSLKRKGAFSKGKRKNLPPSRDRSFEETLFRFFSFLFHTLKRTLIKRNEKGGSAQDTNKGKNLPPSRDRSFEETLFRFFSFFFVSFRFFSFLFHTLKRTLIKRNEKGGSA